MITGSLVALVTPMLADGQLDMPRFRALIDFHAREGTDGLVIVGTTGESPTVDVEEHCELIRVAVEHAAGRLPIIAGTGANSTSEAIELSRFAKQVGAQASLSVVPYYNKPTQEGLYQHFKAIAEAVDLAVILYNVPGRTVADLGNDTVLRLAQVDNVIGIKDATGSLERVTDLAMRAPKDFALYSGDDMTGMAFMAVGGHGVISVTANVAPRLMHDLCVAVRNGELVQARAINEKLFLLNRDLFVEANPIPVKWAVEQMGLIGPGQRLPLTRLSDQFHARVRAAMTAAGV
ncbi:MAG: 4-hydroxy-tetrahydrodipicolinate synthase [Moraxellaceae bacterium]|nr:4-hydroxy-tetrahydrodipicolinate synthase [Moraxellaceae bacterium]